MIVVLALVAFAGMSVSVLVYHDVTFPALIVIIAGLAGIIALAKGSKK